MSKKHLSVVVLAIGLLTLSVLALPASSSSASTISVKLQNYIGNKQSIDITTKGSYQFVTDNSSIRYSGANRFEVADQVAAAGWQEASTVVIVNSNAFADALSAAPLAYQKNAPILLTGSNELPAVIEDRIKSLSPSTIIIVGGVGSVSENVESKLKTLASDVTRIGGKNRFEVSQLVAANFPAAKKAVVTNGNIFSDALAIAPYAAKNGIPILLTNPSSIPDSIQQALQGKTSTLIIGGEGSVSKKVEDQLVAPTRIGGKNRYEVSANIVSQLGLNAEVAFISNGGTFADALTGSVLAAKKDAPLLLTTPGSLPSPIAKVIDDKKTSDFHILGGTASVTDGLVRSLPNQYVLTQNTPYSLKAENGNLVLYKGNEVIKVSANNFSLVPARYSTDNQILLNDKAYLGNMNFSIESGKYIRPVNASIPYEDYLKGVVPREMPASWAPEALKAQAVAARTYSIDDVGKTVLDTINYQVYGGYLWDARTTDAVNATKGKVLKYKDANGSLKLVSTFFSSSNGGYTSTNKEEWGTTKLSYFAARADSFDPSTPWSLKVDKVQIDPVQIVKNQNRDTSKALYNPGWWWSATEKDAFLANSVKSWLSTNGYSNKEIKVIGVNDFIVGPERNAATRATNTTLKVNFYMKDKTTNQFSCENGVCDGTAPLKKYSVDIKQTGVKARSMFGTTRFKSSLLTSVSRAADSFTIQGKGYGHGIGMSQNGAYNRAKAGHKYPEILEFYYPTSILSTES
ncbi:SpoIID/LytB domain-containing protein [Bacillus sp. CECT 9360]|uniref:SpoIID/LytB domain-containing protein n=1 Tax=Bacillus sp. CECT 9360 TaxID=2845821 RepID=UPI001E63E4BA|nr:SpoIID/LytB domain-containing protein [Bacillus sp. CECT 9360]CAH0345165.1 Amidase enhancer [Bacillus sp. CECT 9360]